MQMTGEYRIEAPRETVWAALVDPDVLKRCIPGCEELEQTSESEFTAKVKAKVGPVSAKFAGAVSLSDLNPPESYRISGEGKGGAAGFAKGGAMVTLAEDGGATMLAYEIDAQVGGKLAQIGQRLIAGTAKKMADDFFGRLVEAIGAPAEAVAAPAEAAVELAPARPSDADVGAGARIGVWVAGTILAVLILLAIFGLG
ncbi:MAG: carbon monoxide dehydrogenase subunit G [Rhodospirillales bacterium]|nr:carbon monoxide dehydrogenase subunit G [Rhodospirillales bacterium]MDH3912586.1 carbon monoxide dehydrogenase subunit G [Rhodospirillales bacterium]MDH3920739.1 carbon monoxide dehydrogenase subunit G [Rhodospirillales bacterium]MDH3967524.1 carbon monoxide dehydrogenase subunit G [Rhodospirillales bacterium]